MPADSCARGRPAQPHQKGERRHRLPAGHLNAEVESRKWQGAFAHCTAADHVRPCRWCGRRKSCSPVPQRFRQAYRRFPGGARLHRRWPPCFGSSVNPHRLKQAERGHAGYGPELGSSRHPRFLQNCTRSDNWTTRWPEYPLMTPKFADPSDVPGRPKYGVFVRL